MFHPGQVNRPGTFAEYTLVDERIVGKLPDAVSFVDAAALPMTALTAHELLFQRMGIPEGAENGSVLVINGAGGVGSIAIQLLRAFTDMTVIATASRPESGHWCKKMGAHYVISHRERLSKALAKLDHQGVDFVACLSHTEAHLPEIIQCIKPFGTIGLIDQPKSLDIMPLREKALRIAFEGVFVKALMQTTDMSTQGQVLTQLGMLLAEGALQTTRNQTLAGLTVENARQAHMAMETGATIGKIVLVPHVQEARGGKLI
ncbi:zinc-binding dehydrogenase [Tianweitania sp. BSSL-BM11]|uniref:Zinc-binding dehydrogenase n=1 Tax=Tianweitania aestuarii TaxID=2814886 RepID=A0ABS5RVN1_9HYPH|nr:zinc-binding dehydrogenase [Tianweitania aestuarii]